MAILTLAILLVFRVGVSLRLHRLNEWLARREASEAFGQGHR